MNAELNDLQNQPEEEDRLYLESLILQLKDMDPRKSRAARTELETMLGILQVASLRLENSLEVAKTAKDIDKEDIRAKERRRGSLAQSIYMVRNALYKSLPVPNGKHFGSKN